MTHYLLSVHHAAEGPDLTEEEMEASFKATDVFNSKLQDQGVWVFAGGLEAPDTASVVRVEDGSVVTTDGPYVETKEQLGGFWIIDVPTLEVARELAAEGSVACMAPVEVRPFQGVAS